MKVHAIPLRPYAYRLSVMLYVFVVANFLDIPDTTSVLLSLVALCADGGAGDGSGGSDGGSVGGEHGDSIGSVGNCGNPSSGDEAGFISGFSTPFLCTWNGGKFVFENDFLYGKPISSFYNIVEGIRLYEDRAVTPDLYKIQNSIYPEDGRMLFQIKEIEPEESFIDHLLLSRVVHPQNTELIVDSSFKKFVVFENSAILEREGVVAQEIYFNGKSVADVLSDNSHAQGYVRREDGYFMDPDGDVVEVRGKIMDKNNDTYLLIRSHFRDWTLGEVFDTAYKRKSFSFREIFEDISPRTMAKGGVLVFLMFLLSAMAAVGALFQRTSREYTLIQAKKLSSAFDVPRALADVPSPPPPAGGGQGHSLVVEGWGGTSFQVIDVFSPRYYQPSLSAIRVPKNIVQNNGDVRLRITSTKRHKIHFVGLIAPRKEISYTTEFFPVRKAFLARERRDYTHVLNEQYSGEYMHVIPGDVVDIEFSANTENLYPDGQESYLLHAGGVYTSASEETQRLAGDWVSKLDPESRAFLHELYSLRRYHDINRTPVV